MWVEGLPCLLQWCKEQEHHKVEHISDGPYRKNIFSLKKGKMFLVFFRPEPITKNTYIFLITKDKYKYNTKYNEN